MLSKRTRREQKYDIYFSPLTFVQTLSNNIYLINWSKSKINTTRSITKCALPVPCIYVYLFASYL